MINTVLKSISAENFASFANRIEFTTEIDAGKKEYLENSFTFNDTAYNKVVFLYGTNGSGKTYFCKIIREIQRILDWSPLTAMNNPQVLSLPQIKSIDRPVNGFAFDVKYKDKPSIFSIDVVIDNITYHYEFSVLGREIVSEILTKKYRRTEVLIERRSSDNKSIILRSELKSFDATKHVVKPEALCLPVAALLNNQTAVKIVTAIQEINVVNMTAANLQPTKTKDSFSKERIEKYTRVLQKADPTIRNISVSYKEEELSRQKIEIDDFENREFIETKTTVAVKTNHAVLDEDGKEFNDSPIAFFTDESLGTVKLFTALPYLFDALEKGGILLIDEIENGLHLSLAKEIVQLFISEETNTHHAQLICTSHQPLLLSGEFRRDQVWVTYKDDHGKSELHRLSEMKTKRAAVDLSSKILEGVFGCNPNLFFKDNT